MVPMGNTIRYSAETKVMMPLPHQRLQNIPMQPAPDTAAMPSKNKLNTQPLLPVLSYWVSALIARPIKQMETTPLSPAEKWSRGQALFWRYLSFGVFIS